MSRLNLKPQKNQSRASQFQRQELEIDIVIMLLVSLAIFLISYMIVGLIPPLRASYVGTLFFDRGFIQYLSVASASIVVAITLIKFLLLKKEHQALSKIWIADHIPLDRPDTEEVEYFQQRLMKDGSLVALRCGRVLKAYIQSGDRTAATEFAIDDSSFYASNSELSYSFPRILVWAIPLLGFIGTVLGISGAVSGFSGFINNSGDVEQIKKGIGTVTNSLGVAFDTTLLALFLSVIVMIPLVLVERYESSLLLNIDVFINDKLLPRLAKKKEQLDPTTINQELVQQIRSVVEEIRTKNTTTAQDLNAQTQGVSQQLEKVAQILETKVGSLETSTLKTSGFPNIQPGVEGSFASFEQTSQLESVLSGIREHLDQLQPVLQQLNKPRRITLVEHDHGKNSR